MNNMCSAEAESYPEATQSVLVDSFDDRVMELLWGEDKAIMSSIPVSFTHQVSSIRVNLIVPNEDGTVSDSWKSRTEFYIKPNVGVFVAPNRESNPSELQINSLAIDDPFVKEWMDYKITMRDINLKWDKLTRQVTTFIEGCKSLNEALKLWPDVRLYIPIKYMERVEKKVEKSNAVSSSAVDALKNIDTDFAVGAVVGARMAMAGNK
jgi:hypothetical protein